MNDPDKLKITSNSTFCRVLLESAGDDHAPRGAAHRALRSLSIGAGVTAVGAIAKAGASAGLSSPWPALLGIKWLAIGLVAGVATLGSVEQLLGSASEVTPRVNATPAPQRAPRAPSQRRVAAKAALPLASRVLPEVDVSSERTLADLPPHTVRSEGASPSPDPLNILRDARAALGANAPRRALSLLDDFDRRFGDSALAEEAAVLRIDAQLALGSDEAKALAAQFLRRYPRSAYGARIRSKLEFP